MNQLNTETFKTAVSKLKNDKTFSMQSPLMVIPNPQTPYAQKYHRKTDLYDQIICKHNEKGIPVTSAERILINRNALKVRDELLLQMKRDGVDVKGFQKTIHFIGRHLVSVK